jgi:hypothetical protein
MSDLRTCDNEINLPDVYNGLGVGLNIMIMNNCFRFVLGCVASGQQDTSWPYCLFGMTIPRSEIGSVVKSFLS